MEIMKDNAFYARFGIYNTPSWCGDEKTALYDNEELDLYICCCKNQGYVEVFGLSEDEFQVLTEYVDYYIYLLNKEEKNEII